MRSAVLINAAMTRPSERAQVLELCAATLSKDDEVDGAEREKAARLRSAARHALIGFFGATGDVAFWTRNARALDALRLFDARSL